MNLINSTDIGLSIKRIFIITNTGIALLLKPSELEGSSQIKWCSSFLDQGLFLFGFYKFSVGPTLIIVANMYYMPSAENNDEQQWTMLERLGKSRRGSETGN